VFCHVEANPTYYGPKPEIGQMTFLFTNAVFYAGTTVEVANRADFCSRGSRRAGEEHV